MIEKWYENKIIPIFIFLAISISFCYFGFYSNRKLNSGSGNLFCIIEVEWQGMSSSYLEKEITVPLENKLSSLKEITEMKSVSEDSKVTVSISFDDDVDKENVYYSLSSAIDEYYAGIKHPIRKPSFYFSDNQTESDFLLAIYTKHEKNEESFIKDFVKVLENQRGISRVQLYGNQSKEYRVTYNNDVLATRKFNPNDISSAVQKTNPLSRVLSVESKNRLENIYLTSRVSDINRFKDLDVKLNGQFVKFNEIAEINLKEKDLNEIVKLNGKECVEIDIKALPNTNRILLSKMVRKTIHRHYKEHEYSVLYDSGENQYESLKKICIALIQSMLLVSLVIPLFFYGKIVIFFIVLFLPVSLTMTIFLISALGIEINHFLIAGLTVSMGNVIDPVLIIAEQKIHSDDSKSFIRKIKDLIPSLISSIGTNLIVFVPFMDVKQFLPGMEGMIVSMIIMSVVSFILAIMFFPWILINLNNYRLSGRKFTFMKKDFNLSKKTSAIVYVSFIIASIFMIAYFEKDSSTSRESNFLTANIEYNPEKRKEWIDESMESVIEIVKNKAGVENILSVCRKGNCQLNIKFNKEIIDNIEFKKIQNEIKGLVKDGFVFMEGEQSGKKGLYGIEIAIEGPNAKKCRQLAVEAGETLKAEARIENIVMNFKTMEKTIELLPDYDFLRFYNSSPYDFGQNVFLNMNAPVIDKFWIGGKECDVSIGEKNYGKITVDDLLNETIGIESGVVRIRDCSKIKSSEEIGSLYRKNNRNCAYFTVYIKGSKVKKVKQSIRKIMNKLEMENEYTYSFDRKTQNYEEEFRSITISLVLAVLLLYILLCALNEKPLRSFGIISIIPASFVFSFVAKLFQNPCLGIGDFVGMSVSSGLVVNNAILIEQSGLEKNKRSIFITNVTTILGSLPVLLSGSTGLITDLSFHMMYSSIGALVISFMLFPHIICNTSAHKCSLQVQ